MLCISSTHIPRWRIGLQAWSQLSVAPYPFFRLFPSDPLRSVLVFGLVKADVGDWLGLCLIHDIDAPLHEHVRFGLEKRRHDYTRYI